MELSGQSATDAYLCLVRAVHELAGIGDVTSADADALCELADVRLFGEPGCEQALVSAEAVLGGLADARVLSPLEIAAMRELLWAIEPVVPAAEATARRAGRRGEERARHGPAAA